MKLVLVRTSKKLLSSLVEPDILYGAEIWGCLHSPEQVQLRAYCIHFGVNILHPRVSLFVEMDIIILN